MCTSSCNTGPSLRNSWIQCKNFSKSVAWWAFRPRKKIFSSPPKIPRGHPPGPSPPPPLSWENPLPLEILNKKPTPAPSWRLGLPLPLPRAEKIKNIRNVHQGSYRERLQQTCLQGQPRERSWDTLKFRPPPARESDVEF